MRAKSKTYDGFIDYRLYSLISYSHDSRNKPLLITYRMTQLYFFSKTVITHPSVLFLALADPLGEEHHAGRATWVPSLLVVVRCSHPV